MTREEALKLSIKDLSADHREYAEDIHKKFIDKIYDDFEKEKKLLWEQAHAAGFKDFAKKLG